MKYSVDFAVRGYKAVEVEADSYEEASRLAEEKINDTDFGVLEEIVCEEIDCSEA